MPTLIAWAAYDVSGDPLPGLTPSFVDYVERDGTSRTPPIIQDLGGGQYGFLATDADAEAGTVYLINNGLTAVPTYVSGAVFVKTEPFAAWHLEDGSGALWTGAPPTISNVDGYASLNGARGAPAVVAAKTYLFTVTPTLADLLVGVTMRGDSPAGASPSYYQETLVIPPATQTVSAGSTVSITHTQATSINASGAFVVTETVVDVEGLDNAIFAHNAETGVFSHVAGAGELQVYPDTQQEALDAQLGYYLQPTATVTYTLLADAAEMVTIFNRRLQSLCDEQAAILDGFVDSQNLVVTP